MSAGPLEARSSARAAGQVTAGLVVLAVVLGLAVVLVRAVQPLEGMLRELFAPYPLVNAFAKAVVVLNFVALHVLFLIWLERKIAAWMQARLGPTHVGWKGLAQTAADALKLFTKEDIIPGRADRALFIAAPFLAFMPTFLTFLVLPFSGTWVGYALPEGAVFVVAVSTTGALGVLAAGWGANNKYSMLGGARAVAQLLSYEIPMLVVILSVVAIAGSMSLTEIVRRQAGLWNIAAHPLVMVPGFLIYLTCALAELNRTPFDLPEAESELVSGFNTEYSGMRFAFFYMAEFAANFFSAGFAVTLFFGGWLGPWLPPAVWFVAKTLLLVVAMMWIRWTLPRLRIDQVMGFCWKALVPLSLLVFCGAALVGAR